MLAERMRRVRASPIMELIKTTSGGNYLSFASGLPDPALFPLEELRSVTDEVLRTDGVGALQYGAAEGYAPLRQSVAAILRRRGLQATADHVLITTGSQQALDLAARALLNPGDRVIVESPTYLAALQVLESLEAEYRVVPMDADGMRSDALTPSVLNGSRLLYTLPNFQNPSGATMTLQRRREVAGKAAAAGVPVLEDDAYHDLRYEGEALPPVAALAENAHAIYTGTFSKVIAPGVRVGYLWAQPALVERLAQLKQITDLHAGSLTQRVVQAYLQAGHLEPGLERFRTAYARRRDVMLAALETHCSPWLTWNRPAGGMFIFARIKPRAAGTPLDAADLLARAMERGLVFVPGAAFHPDGSGSDTLRLNFVSAPEERIEAGIRILSEVLHEWS